MGRWRAGPRPVINMRWACASIPRHDEQVGRSGSIGGLGLQRESLHEGKQSVMLSTPYRIFDHGFSVSVAPSALMLSGDVPTLSRMTKRPKPMTSTSHAKFDPARAQEYAEQARIALAGYDACHELSACILSAALTGNGKRHVLVVGAGGTAGEIIATARLEPSWSFVAVDPSEPMLALARSNILEAGLENRVNFICGDLSALPRQPAFDAALMIGVLHHVAGNNEKVRLLEDISYRLAPGGSLVLAGNYRNYEAEPLLQAAWANRWRLHGASEEEVRVKLARIKAGAVPPASEEAVASLLEAAGFAAPMRFFSSLFWGAWHTRREP